MPPVSSAAATAAATAAGFPVVVAAASTVVVVAVVAAVVASAAPACSPAGAVSAAATVISVPVSPSISAIAAPPVLATGYRVGGVAAAGASIPLPLVWRAGVRTVCTEPVVPWPHLVAVTTPGIVPVLTAAPPPSASVLLLLGIVPAPAAPAPALLPDPSSERNTPTPTPATAAIRRGTVSQERGSLGCQLRLLVLLVLVLPGLVLARGGVHPANSRWSVGAETISLLPPRVHPRRRTAVERWAGTRARVTAPVVCRLRGAARGAPPRIESATAAAAAAAGSGSASGGLGRSGARILFFHRRRRRCRGACSC